MTAIPFELTTTALLTAQRADAAVHAACIVARHTAPLFRYARALGAPRHVAEDLVQESFAIAFEKQKQHLEPAALATFLRRSARYLWLAQCRRQRRAEAAIAAAVDRLWQRDHSDDGGEGWLQATAACVASLQGRAAAAVAMTYTESRSRNEIARALGMQPNGVRTLLARTRRWLADCIRRRTR